MGTVKEWDGYLLERLQDSQEAAAFLNAALEENDPVFFQECFSKVMLARKNTMLNEQDNLSCLASIGPVLRALNLKFAAQ